MVSPQIVEEQLKRISFNVHAWGRTEANELPNILLPDEEIYECVNGIYEGGFALLVATNIRLLLIDKKPLKFLTVEDLRFDMINEIDYSHRLMGAQINISTGAKTLRFRSYNQPRLRKLINHVQHSMADTKKSQSEHQEGQKQHLEQINQQLQTYLLAQYQNQQELNQRLQEAKLQGATVEPLQTNNLQPSPEVANYLFSGAGQAQSAEPAEPTQPQSQPFTAAVPVQPGANDAAEMYAEGRREIFGQQMVQPVSQPAAHITDDPSNQSWMSNHNPLEINALKIAYSKLPMALRNRKFGRPSFHAHSQAPASLAPIQPTEPAAPAAQA